MEDTVIRLRQPGSFSEDVLTDILRNGARQLLAPAIEAEVAAHLGSGPIKGDSQEEKIW